MRFKNVFCKFELLVVFIKKKKKKNVYSIILRLSILHINARNI